MKKTVFAGVLSFWVICGTLAAAKDAAWKTALQQQFQSAYQFARLDSKFVKGSGNFYRIRANGTPLKLQMNGLEFYEDDLANPANVISNGELLPVKGFKGFLNAVSTNHQPLEKGEVVYLTRVEIKDDAVVLHLISRELFDISVDTGVVQKHLLAAVKFDYGKEAMPTKKFGDLKAEVDKVVDVAGAAESKAKSEPEVDQRANDLWRAVDQGTRRRHQTL